MPDIAGRGRRVGVGGTGVATSGQTIDPALTEPVPDTCPVTAEELGAAIFDGQIVPWYQPIIHLATGAIAAVEALARWHRPDGRSCPPSQFVPVAEASGLVVGLDRLVTEGALADLSRWHLDRPGLKLNVNLAGPNLDTPGCAEYFDRAAEAAGVDPRLVRLELTETSRPQDAQHANAVIDDLRAAGFSIWLDDFGAGYYDLRDLVRLSLDGLKIDRWFAAQLGTKRSDAVVYGLVAGAHAAGIEVTIEGIETPAQAERALALGCDFGQGFLWHRPMPADQFTALLRTAGRS